MDPADVFNNEDRVMLYSYSIEDLVSSLEKRPRKDRLGLSLQGTIDKNYVKFFDTLDKYLKNNPLRYFG